MPRKPTMKQKAAFDTLVANSGTIKNSSIAEVMRENGYSARTARTPQKLTESDGWKMLLEEQAPDSLLVQVGREGLQANKVISARVTSKEAGVDTDDFIEVPDHPTRHKFWSTFLDLKGKLPNHSSDFATPIQANVLVLNMVEKVYDSPGTTDTQSESSRSS